MKFYAVLILAVVIVIVASEVSPAATNALLLLLIAGVVLGRWQAFAGLIATVSSGIKEAV